MPRDFDIAPSPTTAAERLLALADFMDDLDAGLLDMRTVHHSCGTVHCAWGWGEQIGLFPRADKSDDESDNDAVWTREMETAEEGRSEMLGLDRGQFRHCFGLGYQFRTLGRPYTPQDVARHLRETAAELSSSSETDIASAETVFSSV